MGKLFDVQKRETWLQSIFRPGRQTDLERNTPRAWATPSSRLFEVESAVPPHPGPLPWGEVTDPAVETIAGIEWSSSLAPSKPD